MKRVLFITNIPSTYRVQLFDQLLIDKEYDVHVLYCSSEDKELRWTKEKLKHNHSFIKSFGITRKTNYYTKTLNIPNIIEVYSSLNKIRPNVIIAAEYSLISVFSFIYTRIKGTPYIVWSDATLFCERDISKLKLFIRKLLCKNAATCIASSTETVELLETYGASKDKIFKSLLTCRVGNNNEQVNEREKAIIAVGYLFYGKGYDLLFKAIEKYDKSCKVHIIGDGDERQNLEQQARSLGLTNVIFHGNLERQEIDKLFSSSSLFVFPTREDCFGLVAIEAMFNGLPVIVSKYAGCAKDLVLEGENGYIIDPEDAIVLAEYIKEIIEDQDKIKTFGEKSLDIASQYTIEKVCVGIYQALEHAGIEK